MRQWYRSGLWISLVVLVVGMSIARPVQAQKFKIAVVDLQAVLDDSALGRAAKERLKVLGEKLQQEIQSKRDFKEKKEQELQKLRGEIRSQGLVLSEQARVAKEEEFRKKIRELKRFIDDTNNFLEDSTREFREKEVRETQGLIVDIRKVVREIGEREGYTLVLEGNDNAAVVLYASQTINITQQVVQRYDQTSASRR